MSDHNTIISEVDLDGISNIEEKKVNHSDTEIPDYDLMNTSDEHWSKAKEWMEELNYDNITNDQLVYELENMVKHVFQKKEMNSKTSQGEEFKINNRIPREVRKLFKQKSRYSSKQCENY